MNLKRLSKTSIIRLLTALLIAADAPAYYTTGVGKLTVEEIELKETNLIMLSSELMPCESIQAFIFACKAIGFTVRYDAPTDKIVHYFIYLTA